MTPIDTSAPFWPWFYCFLLLAYGIVACIGDVITTMVGLGANKGFVEGNPLARWMFSKFGESLTGWMTTVAYAFTGLFIVTKYYRAGMCYIGAVAATETFFAVKNYRLLKKLGISI